MSKFKTKIKYLALIVCVTSLVVSSLSFIKVKAIRPDEIRTIFLGTVDNGRLREYCKDNYPWEQLLSCTAIQKYTESFRAQVCRHIYGRSNAFGLLVGQNGADVINCYYDGILGLDPKRPYLTLTQEIEYCKKIYPTLVNYCTATQVGYLRNSSLNQTYRKGMCEFYFQNARVELADDAIYCPNETSVTKMSGDFNNDGISDLFLRDKNGNNLVQLLQINPNSTMPRNIENLPSVPTDSGWYVVGIQDFNGDGISDILWRRAGSGENHVWIMNSLGRYFRSIVLPQVSDSSGWYIASTGDYNGDRRNDIFWRNWNTGDNHIWLLDNQAQYVSSITQPKVYQTDGWKLVGSGDFNGDGRSEVLWRNTRINASMAWLFSSSAAYSSDKNLPYLNHLSGWTYGLSADINGDNLSDMIWQNPVNLQATAWLGNSTMSNFQVVNLSNTPSRSSVLTSTGDFNRDGRDELLWVSDLSGVSYWKTNSSGNFESNTSLIEQTSGYIWNTVN